MPDYEPGDDPSQSEWVLAGFEEKLEKLFRAALKEVLQLIPQPEVKTQAFEDMSYTLDEIDNVFSRVYKQGESVVAKETEKAYKQGWLYGGIRLGEPPEVRKGIWGAIGARVIKSQSDFRKITDATAGQIRGIIAEGVTAERNYGVIAGEITQAVDSVGINRAKTMVRSETMRAVNDGVKDRYASNGVQLYRRLEASDERTCHDWPFEVGGKIYSGCAGIDGKIFTREQADSIDRQTHPNCRGTWTPHIEVPEEGEEEAAPEEEPEPFEIDSAPALGKTPKSVKDFEEGIATNDYETVAVFDKNGKLLATEVGEETNVDYSTAVSKHFGGNVVTHNHPGGGTFSRRDIEVFHEYGIGEMRAVSKDGVYIIRPKDGLTAAERRKIDVGYTYSDAYHDKLDAWMDQVDIDTLTQAQKNQWKMDTADQIYRENADKLGLKYQFVKGGKEEAVGEPLAWYPKTSGQNATRKVATEKALKEAGLGDARHMMDVDEAEMDALDHYVGDGFQDINAFLRKGKIPEDIDPGDIDQYVEDYVKPLDQLLSRHHVPKGVELYRGTGPNASEAIIRQGVGSVIDDLGYQSFSYDIEIAEYFVGMNRGPIDDPKYVILRYISDGKIGGAHIASAESEVLLSRGCSWKVIALEEKEVKGKAITYATVQLVDKAKGVKKKVKKVKEVAFNPKKLLWNPNSITLDSTVAKKEANALVEKLGLVDVRKNPSVGLTPKQKKEINNYVGSGYGTINSYLRNGKTSAILSKILKELDATIAKGNSLKKGTELYRGVGYNTSMRLLKCKPGDILEDAAYQSFSINPQVAHSFSKEVGDDKARVVLRFVADGDTRGVFISEGDEYEYILARGTKMEILSIDEGNSNGLKTLFYTVKVVK